VFQALSSMVPSTTIASFSRVFLGSSVPGWHRLDDGLIRLPLTLDGATTNIGIHIEDNEGFTEWVNDRCDFFASTHKDFDLYPTEASYRAAFHPSWISKSQEQISNTISEYAESLPPFSRIRKPFLFLQNRWSEMQNVLSAALYMGNPKKARDFTLFAQDLTLFGPELSDVNDLGGLLNLLDTTAHVDDLLRMGMTDLIHVKDEDGKIRGLHDAAAATEEPWLCLVDAGGKETRRAKHTVRSVCTYELDDERRVDPFLKASVDIHEAYDVFEADLKRRNLLVIGAYLIAHFGMTDDDVKALQQKGFRPEALQSHLRATGRQPQTGLLHHANLLVPVLRRIGEAP
jgi:hypothetical protein